jgi:pimeloyl-ACP methyl ester carboxylesterase
VDVRWLQLQRDGARLWAADYGGNGPPALLLHGLLGHAREWDATAEWLTRTHRVVALDQRGHGRSERQPADVSPEAFGADAEGWIEHLGLAPAVVVGQSLGGLTALRLAARRPALMRALVVCEATPAADPEGGAAVRGWLAGWPVPFASATAARAFFGGDSLFARAWTAGLEQRDDGLHPAFDADVLLAALSQAEARDAWAEWSTIRCPALIVRAAGGAPRGEVRRMLDLQPRARRARAPRRDVIALSRVHTSPAGNPARGVVRKARQMATPPPALGRASLGLVALDSPAWAVRRGIASLEGDLPAAIVRIDAGATAPEVRTSCGIAASAGAAVAWIPEAAPVALAELLARACPDVILDSALCGDELAKSLLGWTSVCDLADLRTDPWRVAIALGSESDGALDGLDGVDVLGRGADARRLAEWLALGVEVPVWIVGDATGIDGVRLRFGTHERIVPPPAIEASASLGDALDLVSCGHELVKALQGSAARLRRTDG